MGGGQSKRKAWDKAWDQAIQKAKGLLSDGEVGKTLVLLNEAEEKMPRDAEEESRRRELQKLKEEAAELQSAIGSTEAEAIKVLDRVQGEFDRSLHGIDSDSLLAQLQPVSSSVQLFLQEHRGSSAPIAPASANLQPWSQQTKHASLSVKENLIQCAEAAAVRSIFLGKPLEEGRVYCEIQVGNFVLDSKVEFFFGVVDEKSVKVGDYWFEEDFKDRAFFLSSDGDICNGETILMSIDASSWRLDTGDTLGLEFDYEENAGSLYFYKQSRRIPFQITNIKFPGVVAVLFSDCPKGSHLKVLSYFRMSHRVPPPMAAAEAGVEATTQSLSLSRLQAISMYLKALAAIVELCKELPVVSIQECVEMLRAIKENISGLGEQTMAERIERLLFTVSTTLRLHKVARLDDVMQSGQRMLESEKVAQSIDHYNDATQLASIISDLSLTQNVLQSKKTAMQRKEVILRNANSQLQTIYARVHSKDIQILQTSVPALLSAADQCHTMYENCAEIGKSQEVSSLKQMLMKLEEASLLFNDALKKIQQGRLSKASFHFLRAKEDFQKTKALVYASGNEHWIRYIDEQIAMVGDELVSLASESNSNPDEFKAEFDQAISQEEENNANRLVNHVDPILKGDFQYRRQVKQHVICIYVSSSLEEHEEERNLICGHLKRELRTLARFWGFELEIFDPLHLLPPSYNYQFNLEFHEDCSDLRLFCQDASCSMDYMCLLGSSSNGKAFPRKIDQKHFESILLTMGDHGQNVKRRKAMLEWFRLDTNSDPSCYVLVDPSNRSSRRSKSSQLRDKGNEAWTKAFNLMQDGFHDACVQQVIGKQKQIMRDAILGKLGVLDSSSMKRRVKTLFNEIDSDNSGLIDSEELIIAFEQLGIHLGQNEIGEFLKDFDEDGSGTIDFEEFLLMIEGLLLDAKK